MFIWNPQNVKCHIECDNCHCKAENNEYSTESEAELWLPHNGWLCVWNFEKEHYCPNCYEKGKEKNRPFRVLGRNVIIKK